MAGPPGQDTSARRASFLDSLGSDVRLAIRSLAKSPGFLATAILSLALGIGAASAAFGVLDAVRFRALPFKDAERLVLVSEVPVTDAPAAKSTGADRCRTVCDVSYDTFSKVLQPYPFRTLDVVAGYTSGGKALGTGAEPLIVSGGIASQNLFDLLGAKPFRGRAFLPEDDRLGVPLVTILSYDLWATHFGQDPAIIGRTIKLSDSHYTVIGIMPPGFEHEVESKFWLPAVPTLDPSTRPSIRSLTVIGRLRRDATLAQLNSELSTIEPVATSPTGRGPAPATRLEAAPLRERYAASTRSHDVIFAAVVGCVLLIACANLANLILVRTLHQQREFAIRAALGAGTGRLTRYLLTQHLLLVVFSAALGLLLARWSLDLLQSVAVLNSLRPGGMEYRVDARVAAFAVALAVVVGVVLSLVPARVIARADAQHILRESAPTAGGGRWGNRAQQLFVVAQIACAVVLLAGAGLMTKTVLRLSRVDLGFDAGSVVQGTPSFPHPWRVKEKYLPVSERILVELGQLPGAAAVALRASVPLGGRGSPSQVTPEGQAAPLAEGLAPPAALSVSPDYFRTLGVTMVRGRPFSDRDTEASPQVVIVNQWAARRWWPGQDAIGKTIRVDTARAQSVTLTVVGVAADNMAARPNMLLSEDGPELYRPYLQAPSAFPGFFVRSAGDPTPLLRPVREVLVRLVPDRPLFASLFSERVADQLRGVRTNALQILGFAVVGLLLAIVGVHGVLSYAVGRRTREIGIRGALGATRLELATMVVGDAARLTIVGLMIGLPAAALATGIIHDLLHGTSTRDPLVFAGVAACVVVVSLIASWLPARRASRVEPIIALRAT